MLGSVCELLDPRLSENPNNEGRRVILDISLSGFVSRRSIVVSSTPSTTFRVCKGKEKIDLPFLLLLLLLDEDEDDDDASTEDSSSPEPAATCASPESS